MSRNPTQTYESAPAAVYCPRCGRPMLIAPQHAFETVSCPHCGTRLEPWRIQAASPGAAAAPYPTPPIHPAGALPGPVYSWRNRWIAGALGILLGTFGVHRFYLGYTGIGVIQLIVCVLTIGVVSSIWGFIEGILCFCGAIRDVDGLPLSG